MSQDLTVCVLSDTRVVGRSLRRRGRQVTVIHRFEVPFEIPDSLFVCDAVEDLAAAISDCMARLQDGRMSLHLVVPLNWCLTHWLDSSGKRRSVETMRFELEEFLPLPLEELTCTFSVRVQDKCLGVALPTAPMQSLLTELRELNLDVERIHVDALLLKDAGINGFPSEAAQAIRDSRWVRRTPDPSAKESQLLVRANGCGDAVSFGADVAVLELGDNGQGSAESYPENTNGRADPFDRLAVASSSAPLNLAVGELAGQSRWYTVQSLITQILATTCVLVGVCLVGMYVHTEALERHTDTIRDRQMEAYRQVFDTAVLPPGAAMRLASERIRIEGLTQGEGHQSKVQKGRPIDVLREIVSTLSEDLRIRVTSARIDANQVMIRGHTKEHTDAERIATAMGNVHGLRVRPPRTSRLTGGGVEFSITAEVVDD